MDRDKLTPVRTAVSRTIPHFNCEGFPYKKRLKRERDERRNPRQRHRITGRSPTVPIGWRVEATRCRR